MEKKIKQIKEHFDARVNKLQKAYRQNLYYYKTTNKMLSKKVKVLENEKLLNFHMENGELVKEFIKLNEKLKERIAELDKGDI
tara:strand:+ start:683 stop:931 length:249 start_codon:yes stop_codon:yes gene_type:complete